jgi:endoglycosylceramidase
MNAHGIYVLFDMHEDCLSSHFCTYDGVPPWVIDKSIPKHSFPWPLKGNCSRNWELNELAEATTTAYDF